MYDFRDEAAMAVATDPALLGSSARGLMIPVQLCMENRKRFQDHSGSTRDESFGVMTDSPPVLP